MPLKGGGIWVSAIELLFSLLPRRSRYDPIFKKN
jgi:hypothetical protein